MALPNVIWPWSIFYFKDQFFHKENKESLRIFFLEIEYSKLINCSGGMCQTCQGTTVYGMFGI
jgi:ferredoxin